MKCDFRLILDHSATELLVFFVAQPTWAVERAYKAVRGFVLELMDFILKMRGFVLKMRCFLIKNDVFLLENAIGAGGIPYVWCG